jgi:hypothetical protein
MFWIWTITSASAAKRKFFNHKNRKARRENLRAFFNLFCRSSRLRFRLGGNFIYDRRDDFRGFDAFDAKPTFGVVQFKFHDIADFAVQQRLADGREITDDAVIGIGIPSAKN